MARGLIERWWPQAFCGDIPDPEVMFKKKNQDVVVEEVCGSCAVRLECLAEALDNRIEFGVWGSKTPDERTKLLEDNPGVESWHDKFDQELRQNGEVLV